MNRQSRKTLKSRFFMSRLLYEHDLMQLTETNSVGSEVVGSSDVAGSEAVGTEDDIICFYVIMKV